MVAASRAPPFAAFRMHSSHCLPTIGYLAQVLALPARLQRGHLARFHAIAHLPNNTFSLAAATRLHEIGGPVFSDVVAFAWAASTRTALRTVTSWRHCAARSQLSRGLRETWRAPARGFTGRERGTQNPSHSTSGARQSRHFYCQLPLPSPELSQARSGLLDWRATTNSRRRAVRPPSKPKYTKRFSSAFDRWIS